MKDLPSKPSENVEDVRNNPWWIFPFLGLQTPPQVLADAKMLLSGGTSPRALPVRPEPPGGPGDQLGANEILARIHELYKPFPTMYQGISGQDPYNPEALRIGLGPGPYPFGGLLEPKSEEK